MARGATLVNTATTVTGSFSQLQIAGTGSGVGSAKFDNITFGLPGKDSYGTVYTDTGVLEVSSSLLLEGPILSFKLTEGQVLAYVLD